MKYAILLMTAFLCYRNGMAQDENICPDRPSETESPKLVAPRFLQGEAGFQKEASGGDYTLYHPLSVIRYGLNKKIELRAAIDADKKRAPSHNEKADGLLPVQFGLKAALVEGHGALPQTTLLAMAALPTWASKDNRAPHVLPKLRLLMENKLGKQWELDYNVGAEWDGDATTPQWIATIEPQVSLGEKWQLFVEAYGKWQRGHGPEHAVDAGLGYLISKNVKVDAFAGKGLSHEAPDYFFGTGVSFRFHL